MYKEGTVCAFFHNNYYELAPPSSVKIFTVGSQQQAQFSINLCVSSAALTHQFVNGKIYFAPEPTKVHMIDLVKKNDAFVLQTSS